MKKIFSHENLAMVHNMKNILELEQIATVIQGEHRSFLAGQIPMMEAWPELWILDDSQEERARKLVEEAR